jgi:hypothetical protein
MKKKEKSKTCKEKYVKPEMKKLYSPEHKRSRPFEVAITSCGCGGCGSF